jgi:MoaA/NifB/PqqE/SkfB family radical SAM enzyme/polysaccharide pyruvyl transferase WcaK-like protein
MLNKIRLLYSTWTQNKKLVKPVVLQFPVIDICNSKCSMCNIWRNEDDNALSVQEFRSILSDELYSEIATVGLNGGEPTLRKDLPDIVAMLIETLPKLETIGLITNGFSSAAIKRTIKKMYEEAERGGVKLDVMVSLDGFQEVHDLNRGLKNNFAKSVNVLKWLKTLPNVSVRVGCTITSLNALELHPLLYFCIENDFYIKFRLGVEHARLYNQDCEDSRALTDEMLFNVVEFLHLVQDGYETRLLQNDFYRSLIGQLFGNKRSIGCDWQHRGATLLPDGGVAYCAIKSKVLGDGQADSPFTLYFENEDHLQDIVANDCSDCRHDYVGLPERKFLTTQLSLRLNNALNRRRSMRYLKSSIASLAFVARERKARSKYPTSSLAEVNAIVGSRYLLVGWYGTETLGDKAILGGVIETIRADDPEAVITVVSFNEYVSANTLRQMPYLDHTILTIEDAFRQLESYKYVFFAGGPVMALHEMAEITELFKRARSAGAVTGCLGVGVGPLGETVINKSISEFLNNCDVKIFRDVNSMNLARTLGVNTQSSSVSTCPSIVWLGQRASRRPELISKESFTITICFRDLPHRQYAKELGHIKAGELQDRYLQEVRQALINLNGIIPNLIVNLLPMCTNHFGSDDRLFLFKNFRELSAAGVNVETRMLNRELGPDEYLKEFAKTDILFGMRYHSIIFGLACDTKIVAFDYTMGKGKVKAISDQYGLASINLLNVSSSRIVDVVTSLKASSAPDYLIREDNSFRKAVREALI